MTLHVPRGTPTVVVLRCSGCSHDPHEPSKCKGIAAFTREACGCTFTRHQVYRP